MELLRYYELNADSKKARLIIKTVKNIEAFLVDEKKSELADFIYQRLFHRYIKPFTYKKPFDIGEEHYKQIEIEGTNNFGDEFPLLYKNGFSVMANCCLLIETLESFYQGWEDTKDLSEDAFVIFLTRDQNFTELSGDEVPTEFYKHVRCGILHQGETTGGWTITRNDSVDFFDKNRRRINASKFLKKLKGSLDNYKKELNREEMQHPVWVNAIKKIKVIIENTKTVAEKEAEAEAKRLKERQAKYNQITEIKKREGLEKQKQLKEQTAR